MQNKLIFLDPKKVADRSGEQGFSLLELIIAMVVFLIVTGAIYGVLQISVRSRSVVNEQVQLTKNLRVSLNLVGRDTYNAGYGYQLPPNKVLLPDNRISTLLGIANDPDTTRDTVPPIIAGNDRNANNLDGIAGLPTDQVTFLFKDSSFNRIGKPEATDDEKVSQPLNIKASSTPSTGIDEIVPISGSNSVCRKNDLYLVTGNTGSTLVLATDLNGTDKIQFSTDTTKDVLGFNQTGDTGSLKLITLPGNLLRVKMVTYMVTTDGILIRREFANNPPVGAALPVGFIDEPLVYGVENFQIEYIMDNGDVSNDPGAGVGGIANTAAVRQIRFTVSVKSSGTDARGLPYRATMTSTFSTRNLGYDAN